VGFFEDSNGPSLFHKKQGISLQVKQLIAYQASDVVG
jgi:hypothetical protein